MDSSSRQDSEARSLAASLRAVRAAAGEFVGGLRQAREQLRRGASYCADGRCYGPGGSGSSSGAGGGGGAGGFNPFAGLSSALLRGAFSGAGGSGGNAGSAGLGDALRQSLAGSLRGLISSLSKGLSQSLGGGPGGSLFGGLLGAGLSALAGGLIGRLFRRRQPVEPRPMEELLNFPRLSSLDLATNPASRLFGGRAVSRGPAFSVEVSYRGGAEEIVAAKVASKLLDINAMRGVV
ncbi:hypothetical protein IT575_01170 [bacterium]|nr:hypothetical protein [bacterium]